MNELAAKHRASTAGGDEQPDVAYADVTPQRGPGALPGRRGCLPGLREPDRARVGPAKPMEEQSLWPEHAVFMNRLVDEGLIALGRPAARAAPRVPRLGGGLRRGGARRARRRPVERHPPDPRVDHAGDAGPGRPRVTWQERLDALWASVDDLDEDEFRRSMDELTAELGPDSAVAAYERGSAFDSTGHSDLAVPLYERALELGLGEDRRRPAMIQMASSLRATSGGWTRASPSHRGARAHVGRARRRDQRLPRLRARRRGPGARSGRDRARGAGAAPPALPALRRELRARDLTE